MQAQQDWVRVSPAVAARHPLFGVAGWLAVFLVLQSIGLVFSVIGAINDSRLVDEILGSLDGAAAFWTLATLAATWIALIYGIVATVMGFGRHAGFPHHIVRALGAEIIACLLSFKFIDLLITRYGMPAQELRELQAMLGVQIGVAALLIWYYRVSARVQITYLTRARPNDPHLANETGAVVAEPQLRPLTAATAEVPAAAPAGPVLTATSRGLQDRLAELKALFDRGLIDEAAFKERQATLLREL